jgi:CO/xanthine dehydrogenase Mo-binding subunit
MNTDGTIDLMTGTNEVGAGQHMEQRMIAAETLGAALSDVNMMFANDSSVSTDTGASVGSSQTKRAGGGTKAAATVARAKLFELVTTPQGGKPPLIDAKPEDLDAANSVIFLKSDPSKKVTFKQAVALSPAQIVASAYNVMPSGYLHLSFAAFFAEVEVDMTPAL